jgi:hypothetical protein
LVIMFVLTIVLIAIIMGIRFSCNKMLENSYHEIGRLSSPDSLHDVIILKDTTSTEPRLVRVYISKTGSSFKNFDAVTLLADHLYGLSIIWRNPKLLEIHYRKARIFKFYNIWGSDLLLNNGHPMLNRIEIKLVKDGDEELDVLRD